MPMKWRFRQRSQHPAYDEFNAALNYIYGIGYSDEEKIIILSGLEPNSGFYHTDSYGKPTLSYDLMELVRAWLDRTVVSTFTRREAKENWFEKQREMDNAIFLTKVGRKALLSLYREINKTKIESEIWRYCSKIIQMLMGENESEKEYVLCNI
jgi:CRISP-associated protein Cas1